MDFAMQGRVALVTGSARGLGYEIVRTLLAAGTTVYVNSRDPANVEQACTQLAGEGLAAEPLPFDVSDESAQQQALGRIIAAHGRLDVLVNNVGTRLREPLERIGGAELQAYLNGNLVSAFSLSRRAADLMATGGYGRIINMSSIMSLRGRQGDAAYIIAKGALNAMTHALAAEFGPRGITCNAILPGAFRTETNEALYQSGAMEGWLQQRTLLQRPADPSEIGGAALFLASPLAAYVTGILLPVDGGYLATA